MAQKYFKANHLKLEKLRVERGLSREELAARAIVSTRTIDSIMAGKSAVLSTYSKLAKALRTPINTIIDGFEMPSVPYKKTWSITISISTPYDEFDETKDLPPILKKLVERLGGDEIWGAEVSAGSTNISFYLTDEQHAKLISEYDAGTLSDLGIIDIQAYNTYPAVAHRAFAVWNTLKRATSWQHDQAAMWRKNKPDSDKP